jgi:hypothetical protein
LAGLFRTISEISAMSAEDIGDIESMSLKTDELR